MSQPNLSHLSVFAAIARLGSFQKAAVESGMSTSAVSHAIRGLEERMGVSLFNRTTRSVALTHAGERLFERLTPVLRDVGDAMEEMNHFRATPTGALRINSSRIAARLVLAPLIAPFLAAYPGVHLEIVEDDSLVDVVRSGFDAGVRFEETVPEDMVAVAIDTPKAFAVVGSPAYFAAHPPPATPADLARHDCIRFRFPSGRLSKWEFEKDGREIVLEVNGRLVVGELDVALLAALDGAGLAFIFEELAEPHIAAGALVRALEDWCPSFPGFQLYYPRQRRMPPALRAFIDMAAARRLTSPERSGT